MTVYADTDFFLALLKDTDWLKEKAISLAKKYEGQITTSEATFIELSRLLRQC